MDAKITLSFDEQVIAKAKVFADANNISLSRLTEYLYRQVTSSSYQSLEDFPVSDWVMQVAEGETVYQTRKPAKSAKKEYYESRKK